MKTKLIGGAIVLALCWFFAHKYIEEGATRKAREAETLRAEQETKAAVEQLASRFNATTDWEKQLSKGENYRMSPILGIELEKLWQEDRPFLFIGFIKDISSAGPDTYLVEIEKGFFKEEFVFATELRLSLLAPKATIDLFLQQRPELLAEDSFMLGRNGIAIVAKVKKLSKSEDRGRDGGRVETKTGHGELLGLAYTAGVYYRAPVNNNASDNDWEGP